MGTKPRSGLTFWAIWAAWLHEGAGEANGEMTPGGTPEQPAKRLVVGAPLEQQRLLASWLLGGSAGDEVGCPNLFISQDPELGGLVPVHRADPRIAAGEPTGPTSFWLRSSEDRRP
ncbi:MAG TPA: hypothetical protein VIY26_06080 [Acidimicrobiales bacterium]